MKKACLFLVITASIITIQSLVSVGKCNGKGILCGKLGQGFRMTLFRAITLMSLWHHLGVDWRCNFGRVIFRLDRFMLAPLVWALVNCGITLFLPFSLPSRFHLLSIKGRFLSYVCLSNLWKKGGSVSCTDGTSHPGQVPSRSGGRNAWVKRFLALHHNHRGHRHPQFKLTNFTFGAYFCLRAHVFISLSSLRLFRGRRHVFVYECTAA